ncbi:hypothetical protein MPDQ_002736 [Monascus purpureus]|uniref:Zn(2)-C6 fungal-type domain-containing protein n=1 Tax=Monascus purpureus TaxID=5098 RepID=A0A507QP06_MONPU|nr:hypothetical protein MPDQ_002736 [Monascus purpureus]BDD59308.1 hypothetical protein MAP00_004523 [Monascus purpureus]
MVSGESNQLASKDCRVCNRRRIRCDRTVPSCLKCATKGVACPGYGPRYRWANAAAIRGKFKGLGTPDSFQAAGSPENNKDGIVFPQRTPEEPLLVQSNQSKSSLDTLAPSLPEHIAKRLLDHYATSIAPIMVWLDSDKNAYRRLVIPLAEKHPSLRLSLLAISAAHMHHELELDATFSQSAGQTAILMITERVRQMIETPNGQQNEQQEKDNREIEALLAAMLTLSNHSLLGSELSHAQSHRQAARILINTLTLRGPSDDELIVFLKNQLATYDILACTTLFSHHHIQHAIMPPVEQNVLFGNFLIILHRITTWSLQEVPDSLAPNYPSLSELEEEFELARGLTLLAAGPLMTTSSSQCSQLEFVRLVQMYHHAGMLYACKRLRVSNLVAFDQVEKAHSAKLFRLLEHFKHADAPWHNLPWPIFIAGISSGGDQGRKCTVTDLCQMLSASTRFEHYTDLSAFLQELWQSSHGDWCLLAREWERRGNPIIAI